MCECEHICQLNKCPKIRVIDQNHRVGGHIELKKTLFETLCSKSSIGSHCVQMYLGSPQSYNIRTLTKEDIDKSREYCEKNGKTFYIHCPLICNLSKDPKSDDGKEVEILQKSWKAVKGEVKQMNGLPASCVVHMGCKGSINNLGNNLNDMKIPRNTHISQKRLLLLENNAGNSKNSAIGVNFEEIRKIFEIIDKRTVGLCLDTQHIFASGTNRLTGHEDIVKLFDDLEAVGGVDVIHLNDSKKEFSSKVDRHESIGQGYIWTEEKEGLVSLLDICYEKRIDCILETPSILEDLNLIRDNYMDLQTIDTFRF